MNAHDLANALEKRELEAMEYGFDKELFKATNMLRQQADRIAELEKAGEMVGWGVFEDTSIHDFYFFKDDADNMAYCKGPHAYVKPLYTTPQTKPLSDEELHELIINKVTDYELCRAIEAKVRGEK